MPGRFSRWELPDYDPQFLIAHGAVHTVTALTPKTAWETVGGYDETLPGWEDWAFQLACAERCICTHRYAAPLFTYRKHTGRRRDENYASFDESKAGIVAKFGDYWNGGKRMPGCSSCGGASMRPVAAPGFNQAVAPGPSSDAVLLKYVGARQGAIPYRGQSGTTYSFSAGEERYVLVQDMQVFQGKPDFAVIDRAQPSAPVVDATTVDAPTLVAAGPPPEPAREPEGPPPGAWQPQAAVTADTVPEDAVAALPAELDLAAAAAALGATPQPLPEVEEAMASAQTAAVPGRKTAKPSPRAAAGRRAP